MNLKKGICSLMKPLGIAITTSLTLDLKAKEHSISRNGHKIEKMKTFPPCIIHEFPINKNYGAP